MGIRKLGKWYALINAVRKFLQQKGVNQISPVDLWILFVNFHNYFRSKETVDEAIAKKTVLKYPIIFNKIKAGLDPKSWLILFLQSSLEALKIIPRDSYELNDLSQKLSQKGEVLVEQLCPSMFRTLDA